MAQTEDIIILNVQTGEAVQNMADLKNNVSILKKELDNLEIGSQEYQDTLVELKLNQNALKDAMYATSSSMEDVAKSASGMTESYNSLVHRMASLKEEFRSTTDVMRRAELGQQIKEVNDQLKDLDALQGNFQRNVGNYTESFKKAFGEMPEYAEPLKKAFEGVDKSMGVMAANPLIGIITLLFPLLQKITEELKGNTTAIEAIDKASTALKPVMDFFSNVIQKLAEYLANIITKVTAFVSSNGIFQKVIDGVIGVGNAIVQYVIAPFKAVAAAIKVFKEEGIKGLKDATKAFGKEMESGLSFRQNFKAGQSLGDAIAEGAESKKETVANAVASGIKEGVKKGLEQGFTMADYEKAAAAGQKKLEDAWKKKLEERKEIDALVQADIDATNAEIEAIFDQFQKEQEMQTKQDEENAQKRIDAIMSVASATSSILGSIADMYENNAEGNADAARKAKNVRIASATIDTISGAIAAYMGAVAQLGPIAGPIVGAVQAAAVTAAGMANIAKMKSTNVSTSGGSSSASFSGAVSAPVIDSGIPQTSIINSSTQEDRLNRMAEDQRVYILQSDIEAKGNQSRVRVAEASY